MKYRVIQKKTKTKKTKQKKQKKQKKNKNKKTKTKKQKQNIYIFKQDNPIGVMTLVSMGVL